MPWLVHPVRDQPPSPLTGPPAPSPTLPLLPEPLPLSLPEHLQGQIAIPGIIGPCAAMDGPWRPSYSEMAASPSKPLPPSTFSTPPSSLHHLCANLPAAASGALLRITWWPPAGTPATAVGAVAPVILRRNVRSPFSPSFSAPPALRSPSQSSSSLHARSRMGNPGANHAAQAGAEAPVLFCNLCFSRDHSRSACRLVVPAVLQEIAA
jgi:hypothetical protein